MKSRTTPRIAWAVALALGLGASSAAAGEHGTVDLSAAARAAGTVNGLCPVLEQPVATTGGSADYRGERIGFCCPSCAATFQADPVTYMNRMRRDPAKYAYASAQPSLAAKAEAAERAGSANGICPVMGNLVSPKGGFAEHEGQRIAFCCPGCKARFTANADGYMKALRADPLAYGYQRPGPTHEQVQAARTAVAAINGRCPVMGRLVTATGGAATYQGQKIAFCCPGCIQKFNATPEAYMARMRAEPAYYGLVETPR